MKHLWKITYPVYIIVVLPIISIRLFELITKGYHLFILEENKWNSWLFKWADKLGVHDTI